MAGLVKVVCGSDTNLVLLLVLLLLLLLVLVVLDASEKEVEMLVLLSRIVRVSENCEEEELLPVVLSPPPPRMGSSSRLSAGRLEERSRSNSWTLFSSRRTRAPPRGALLSALAESWRAKKKRRIASRMMAWEIETITDKCSWRSTKRERYAMRWKRWGELSMCPNRCDVRVKEAMGWVVRWEGGNKRAGMIAIGSKYASSPGAHDLYTSRICEW